MATTCKTCTLPIVWLKTKQGHNMPVDADTAKPGDVLFDGTRHTSHFATCPQASEHRRRGA
jgi:hypothetical protein